MTQPSEGPSGTPAAGGRRAIWGWALYDFANSAYTTLIVTFIYGVYFTQEIAPDGNTGTALWSWGVTITAIVVALGSPVLGALADRGGYRRRFLALFTAVTVVTVSLLYLPGPGDVALALTLFVISNIAFEFCGVFYNSYLPDIAPAEQIGRISGYGWALGYLGGLLAMAFVLFAFILPEEPLLFSTEGDANIRATTLLVAVWFALLSIPMFAWVKEPARRDASPAGRVVSDAVRQLSETLREIRKYKQIFWLLVARMIYNDGLVTIFAFGPIFAAETFGFTLTEVMYWGLALNLTAGLGAFLMGFLDDRLGGRLTILITLVGLLIGAAAAVFASSKLMLWFAGIWVGIFVGPNQAASRSLLGRFVPDGMETEFYGFFAFSGKAIAFMGPVLLGTVTLWLHSQRAGMATILAFFVIGGVVLLRVNEREGIAFARSGGAAPAP
jgi:MFS transporter, UMF1 family